MARVEQQIMLGFYSVRKLKEAKKISDHIDNLQVKIQAYKSKKNVTLLNWHKIDELYDFTLTNGQARHLGFLCDQIIHSYVFVLSFNEEKELDGIYFCSDKKRNKELYYLSIDKIIEIFKAVGNNYPSQGVMMFDPETNDYQASNQ